MTGRTLVEELWALGVMGFMAGGILVSYTAYGYAQEALKERVPVGDGTERFEDTSFLLFFQCLTSCLFALGGMALWPWVGWLWNAMAGPHAKRGSDTVSVSLAVWSVEAQTCTWRSARVGAARASAGALPRGAALCAAILFVAFSYMLAMWCTNESLQYVRCVSRRERLWERVRLTESCVDAAAVPVQFSVPGSRQVVQAHPSHAGTDLFRRKEAPLVALRVCWHVGARGGGL